MCGAAPIFKRTPSQIKQPVAVRRHEGYDHGYYFIQSFVADHLAHHAQGLIG
jgi:S-formylglutathione hydrolase